MRSKTNISISTHLEYTDQNTIHHRQLDPKLFPHALTNSDPIDKSSQHKTSNKSRSNKNQKPPELTEIKQFQTKFNQSIHSKKPRKTHKTNKSKSKKHKSKRGEIKSKPETANQIQKNRKKQQNHKTESRPAGSWRSEPKRCRLGR